MNVRILFFLLAGVVFPLVATAAGRGYVPMKIIQTEPVQYPRDVSALGVTEGQAQVALQIDEKGKLTDVLVIGYTHKSFADAALQAIKQWSFEPAWIDENPHAATASLTFSFETKGMIVVDLTVNNVLEVQKLRARSDFYGWWACTLSQLDRIPTPTKVVKPRYPADASNKLRPAVVSVHFYIDQEGKVRLPAVSRETSQKNDEFAAEALEAITQWQFEPPLSRGKPVLVSATQDFNFRPSEAP